MWRKFFLLLLWLGQKMNAQSRSVLPWTVADCVLFCELRHNQVAPSVTEWRPCKTYVTDCHCWTGNVRLFIHISLCFLWLSLTIQTNAALFPLSVSHFSVLSHGILYVFPLISAATSFLRFHPDYSLETLLNFLAYFIFEQTLNLLCFIMNRYWYFKT